MSQNDDASHPTSILEDMGFNVIGKSKLRTQLSKPKKASTLRTAIRKFRSDNEVNMEHLKPALHLLRNQNISKAEFYDSCCSKLTEKIIERVNDLKNGPENQLPNFLAQYFDTYRVPQLRPIVVKLLEASSDNLEQKYIKVICKTPELYKLCNIEVKRACWQYKEALFIEEVLPIVNQYIRNKEDITCEIEQNPINFFTKETTKSRRNWPEVQKIMRLIGKNEKLYNKFMKFLRKQFFEIGNIHLCSLKSEIMMSAHEVSSEPLQTRDTIHHFAWCLDACVRDKKLDSAHLNKIRSVIDEFSGTTDIDKVIDFSMIAADIHVVYFFTLTILRKIKDSSTLPRNNSNIITMCRVLMIAANVKRVSITRKMPTEEAFDINLITQFLPMLATMFVEDNARVMLAKHEQEGRFIEQYSSQQFVNQPSEDVKQFLENNSTAALLYTVQCVSFLPMSRGFTDFQGASQWFSGLPSAMKTLSSRGCWIHLICHTIIISNQFENLLALSMMFHKIVMDDVLRDNLMIDEAMKYQVLRLINQLGFVWGVPRCLQMMNFIHPSSENICIGSAHDSTRYLNAFEKVLDKLQPKAPPPPPKFILFGSPPPPFASP